MRLHSITLLCALLSNTVLSIQIAAQPASRLDTTKVFYLGEIVITGTAGNKFSPFQQYSAQKAEMKAHHQLDVSSAVNFIPGIALSNVGGRNESMIYIRGFDLRQVPVFIDGIPEYVPYDGYVDLARFTTFDLSKITVAKGFSSVLFGANAMGGAINLVTRKPTQNFEYDLSGGIMSSGGKEYSANLGSKQELYYIAASASRLEQKSYPLSNSFKASTYENGALRDNAYRKDTKYSIKAGWTPNSTDEYSFAYISQQGEKGNPVYTGNNPNGLIRFWQWPDWDKNSQYFLSQTLIGDAESFKTVLIKTRFFHDKFINTLNAYDNASYNSQMKKSSFKSYYDDDTWGAVLEASSAILKNNYITIAAHWKEDIHREHNLGEPERTVSDASFSAGIEDSYTLTSKASLVGGISYDYRKELKAQYYDSKTKTIGNFNRANSHAVNAQIGGYYNFSERQILSFSIARKTRFATMKDRYSYKLGTALPNPSLTPEQALNYDLSYQEFLSELGRYKVSLFFSDLRDVMQLVNNVQGNLSQMRNFGKASYYGGELEFEMDILSSVNVGGSYTFLKRKNVSNPEIKFMDTPEHKVIAYATARPFSPVQIIASVEYNTSRYSSSDGIFSAGQFAVCNLLTSLKIYGELTLDTGIQNIFDRNYSLAEGYPAPGRAFQLTVRFRG